MSLPAAAPAAEVSESLNIPPDLRILSSYFISSLVPPRPALCLVVLNTALSHLGRVCESCKGRFRVVIGSFMIDFQQLKQIIDPELILRQVVENVSRNGEVLEGSLSLEIRLQDGAVLLLWSAAIRVEED